MMPLNALRSTLCCPMEHLADSRKSESLNALEVDDMPMIGQ